MGLATTHYDPVLLSVTPSLRPHWSTSMQVLTAQEGFNLISSCSWLHLPAIQTARTTELGHHHILARLPSPLHSFPVKTIRLALPHALTAFTASSACRNVSALTVSEHRHRSCETSPYSTPREAAPRRQLKDSPPCALPLETIPAGGRPCICPKLTSPSPHASPASSPSSHHIPS